MLDGVALRTVEPADADAVVALAGELGYGVDSATVAAQIARLGADGAAFLASAGAEPVGWIHVYRTDLRQSDAFAEIGGLVVTATMRGSGIGTALMDAAEGWACAHGLTEVRLRSRVAREGAHRFYERLGYEVEKTSFTFRRELAQRGAPKPQPGTGSSV
jgi:GNAT superfamily N-acetyltransferase